MRIRGASNFGLPTVTGPVAYSDVALPLKQGGLNFPGGEVHAFLTSSLPIGENPNSHVPKSNDLSSADYVFLFAHPNAMDIFGYEPISHVLKNLRYNFLYNNNTFANVSYDELAGAISQKPIPQIGALLVEYPGYMTSSSKVTSPYPQSCFGALKAGFRFLTIEMRVPRSRIVLMGNSVGGAFTAQLAAELELQAAEINVGSSASNPRFIPYHSMVLLDPLTRPDQTVNVK